MKNENGFTLIEILIAMSLLMLIIFCFAPFFLTGMKIIYETGQGERDIYSQKQAVEEQLGRRAEGEGERSTIVAVFTSEEEGAETIEVTVEGTLVTDMEDGGTFNAAAFYADRGEDKGKGGIALSPGELGYKENYSGDILVAHALSLTFPENSLTQHFKLYGADNALIPVLYLPVDGTSVEILLGDGISYENSPYTLCYFPVVTDTYKYYTAQLQIKPEP